MDIYIALVLFVVGFLYASVGHGGASGYIAVFSIFSIPVVQYKPLILILNMLVAGVALFQFWRAGYMKWSICWPFLLTSVPAAFLGSKYAFAGQFYYYLLGFALLFPVIRLLGLGPREQESTRPVDIRKALVIGVLLGALAGMLNIGGGIFLSPVLILLRWANAKEAASASALFIFMNSLSGFLGSNAPIQVDPQISYWFCAAAIGGFCGSYFGSVKFPQLAVRYLLSLVLLIASVKLLFFM